MIELRRCQKKDETSTQQIPDCVFSSKVSAGLSIAYQPGGFTLLLTASPVIGDLLADAEYDLFYYWWGSDLGTLSQKLSGNAGTSKMISNKELPVYPRKSLGVIRTSAPEGELIIDGACSFPINMPETAWFIFQLVNRAKPADHYQSQLFMINPIAKSSGPL